MLRSMFPGAHTGPSRGVSFSPPKLQAPSSPPDAHPSPDQLSLIFQLSAKCPLLQAVLLEFHMRSALAYVLHSTYIIFWSYTSQCASTHFSDCSLTSAFTRLSSTKFRCCAGFWSLLYSGVWHGTWGMGGAGQIFGESMGNQE